MPRRIQCGHKKIKMCCNVFYCLLMCRVAPAVQKRCQSFLKTNFSVFMVLLIENRLWYTLYTHNSKAHKFHVWFWNLWKDYGIKQYVLYIGVHLKWLTGRFDELHVKRERCYLIICSLALAYHSLDLGDL